MSCWPVGGSQRRLMGMSTPEWALPEPGPRRRPAAEQVAALVIDRMVARYADQLLLMPGAGEAVRQMARHWPLGLASSSPPVLVDAVLDAAELRPLFGAAMSTEQVARG
jgi:beta-phosphoglucomutase-like phosphatase (HAD superfamily)